MDANFEEKSTVCLSNIAISPLCVVCVFSFVDEYASIRTAGVERSLRQCHISRLDAVTGYYAWGPICIEQALSHMLGHCDCDFSLHHFVEHLLHSKYGRSVYRGGSCWTQTKIDMHISIRFPNADTLRVGNLELCHVAQANPNPSELAARDTAPRPRPTPRLARWPMSLSQKPMEGNQTMKKTLIAILTCAAFLIPLCAQAAPADDANAKAYADYAESYKKAALTYDKAAAENERSNYISVGVVFLALGVAVIVARKVQKRQKRYMDEAMAVAKANQEVLKEIRDALRK